MDARYGHSRSERPTLGSGDKTLTLPRSVQYFVVVPPSFSRLNSPSHAMISSLLCARNWLCDQGGWVVVAILYFAAGAKAAELDQAHFEQRVLPLLKSYCYDCHGNGEKEGNLSLDQF